VSSEEELLQLRNEGRVNEDEYRDLLIAVRKAPSKDTAMSAYDADESEVKHKRGKIALALMLLGIILPTICFLTLQMLVPENASLAIGPWLCLSLALEIAALVLGILAWPDIFGKATLITIAAIVAVIGVLLFKV
jgi:hypothetical protein